MEFSRPLFFNTSKFFELICTAAKLLTPAHLGATLDNCSWFIKAENVSLLLCLTVNFSPFIFYFSSFYGYSQRDYPLRIKCTEVEIATKYLCGRNNYQWFSEHIAMSRSDCSVTYFSATGDKPSFKSSGDRRKLSILSTISTNVGLTILSDSQQLSIKLWTSFGQFWKQITGKFNK